ncbi:MAG TPA: SDR family oxidoreductase [Clostridia bacterium]|nr:SDR family oxidoreductase [Clostridia bacterium]
MTFTDRVALVTGGANGIGRCIAEHLLDAGACVAVLDADASAGERLAERYRDRLFFFAGDIADQAVLDAFVAAVTARFPKIHFLVNNAMKSQGGILSGCDYAQFERALRVGVTAPYYLTLRLKDRFGPNAAIVNISSSRSRQSQPDTESYTAAKGGIAALTHALSVSLSGIARVNAVAPGWIETAPYHEDAPAPRHSDADRLQHPVKRVGRPEDIAKLVLFLCGPDAGFITGQEIFADGGMSKLMVYHNDLGWTYRPE